MRSFRSLLFSLLASPAFVAISLISPADAASKSKPTSTSTPKGKAMSKSQQHAVDSLFQEYIKANAALDVERLVALSTEQNHEVIRALNSPDAATAEFLKQHYADFDKNFKQATFEPPVFEGDKAIIRGVNGKAKLTIECLLEKSGWKVDGVILDESEAKLDEMMEKMQREYEEEMKGQGR